MNPTSCMIFCHLQPSKATPALSAESTHPRKQPSHGEYYAVHTWGCAFGVVCWWTCRTRWSRSLAPWPIEVISCILSVATKARFKVSDSWACCKKIWESSFCLVLDNLIQHLAFRRYRGVSQHVIPVHTQKLSNNSQQCHLHTLGWMSSTFWNESEVNLHLTRLPILHATVEKEHMQASFAKAANTTASKVNGVRLTLWWWGRYCSVDICSANWNAPPCCDGWRIHF